MDAFAGIKVDSGLTVNDSFYAHVLRPEIICSTDVVKRVLCNRCYDSLNQNTDDLLREIKNIFGKFLADKQGVGI